MLDKLEVILSKLLLFLFILFILYCLALSATYLFAFALNRIRPFPISKVFVLEIAMILKFRLPTYHHIRPLFSEGLGIRIKILWLVNRASMRLIMLRLNIRHI